MRKNKLIFDISELIRYLSSNKNYTGIQRVVVMVLREFQKINSRGNIWICFTSPRYKEYIAFELVTLNFHNWESPSKTYQFLCDLGILGPESLIFKYKNNPFKYYLHRTRFDFAAYFKNHKIFNKRNIHIHEWKNYRRSKKIYKPHFEKLTNILEVDDKLILIDSTWLPINVNMYFKVKEYGVKIYTFVYDLIPILFPANMVKEMNLAFYSWLSKSIEYTDFYITDSESCKKDLLAFLESHNSKLEVKVLPLVQIGVPSKIQKPKISFNNEYLNQFHEIGGLELHCKNVLADKFILSVGTLEIRKNLWRLVLAWKKLLDQGYSDIPRLVLVGKRGWNNTHFWDLMNSTGNLYGYVSILENVNDMELEALYKNCLFVAMVSRYEGWGLPVGEALSYGKTAVVSNTSSLPEVGRDLVEYCDPASIESIANSVKKLVYQPDYRKSLENKIKHTQLRNWEDVANDLATLLKS